MTLLEIMVVLAILALVMGLVVGPRVMQYFQKSKGETTALRVQKLAHEAFPAWAAMSTKACPEKLEELTSHMNDKKLDDAWGERLEMSCSKPGVIFAVWSKGPDKQSDTPDDITSWQ